MKADEAQNLIAKLLNDSERTLPPIEARELAGLCGWLPLAIRAACFFLIENPDWSNRNYLVSLADRKTKLEVLRPGDSSLDVRAVLGLSHSQLAVEDPVLARRWRFLSVLPDMFDDETAMEIWECDKETSRVELSRLLRRGLIEFDSRSKNYTMHDLMRSIGSELMAGQNVN